MRAPGLAAASLSLAALAAPQKHYKELAYPPLRELVVPEVERIELPNGLRLYLLEDHSFPKVEGTLLLSTGSRLEPPEKAGLASILGQVLRTGGSRSRPGDEVDRLLENAGAAVETQIGVSAARASVFALPEHLPLVLEIFADLLRNPALPDDKIELARVQERAAIARRNDDVSSIAAREFQKLLYGAESPYARTTEYATIAEISRDDLLDFHRRYFLPNRALLGLWGDFDAAEVRSLVERHFGGWERGPAPDDEIPRGPSSWSGGVALVEKDDVNQTSLRIGHPGGRVDDPDYFALTVMAEILGGGFSSRLFQTVRSERGLAYRVRASWNASYDHTGSFVVASSTKSESTVETIGAIVAEIDRIANEPVTEDELRLAKDGILNSFVFNFDGRGEVVGRLMTYDYYGYPRDFLDRYQASVERVTEGDVLRVARQNLHPEELLVLAVGRDEDFDAPLAELGAVRTIEIAIPPPPAAETPEATGESLLKGREVLEKFAGSVGPEASALTGFALEGESVVTTPTGELTARFEIVFAGPDRYRETTVLPFGEIVTVVNGDEAWAATPRGVRELDADQRSRARASVFRHYLGLLWAVTQGMVKAQWLSSAEGRSELLLDLDGLAMRGRFDEATGRLLSLSMAGTNFQGAPVDEAREFSDFGNGSQPKAIDIFHDGERAAATRIATTTLNPSAPAELFARPEPR